MDFETPYANTQILFVKLFPSGIPWRYFWALGPLVSVQFVRYEPFTEGQFNLTLRKPPVKVILQTAP